MMASLELIGSIIAAIVVALSFFLGRRAASNEAEAKASEAYIETRKAVDDADASFGDDPDAARRWLRERGGQRGDL